MPSAKTCGTTDRGNRAVSSRSSRLTLAAIAAVAFVVVYAGPIGPAPGEAARESPGANVGLLTVAFARFRQGRGVPTRLVVPYSRGWLFGAVVTTALFFLLLGRGYVAAGD